MKNVFDVAVLGGGPGGYVAAIRCAQLGKKTVLVEKEKLGGTCLNRGCIPTKTLLHSAEVFNIVKHASEYGVNISGFNFDYQKISSRKKNVVSKLRSGVESLLKNSGVEIVKGYGKLLNSNTILVNNEEEITAENIILATGSSPAKIPIPGIDLENVINSDQVLDLEYCPQTLVIIGGGVIGIEFASLFNAFGSKVTVVEALDSILPGLDEEITAAMQRSLKKKGIDVITSAKVQSLKDDNGIVCEYGLNGEMRTIKAQVCVVAVGRKPDYSDMGLEGSGVHIEKGFIVVDDFMRTSLPNIYAIGDITGKQQLAHVASAQGLIAAAHICGQAKKMNYNIIPGCVYTQPEIATVGLTEKQAKERDYDVKIGRFNVAANGKSMVMGETEGFIKIISHSRTGAILGAHIMAPHATDMVGEFCAVMKAEGTVESLSDTIHPHPTVSEMIMEAAHDVHGLSCHKIYRKT